MADLYGQAGLLNKAYEFITQMPIEPYVIIWRTLLGACSIHGVVRLAKKVKDRLAELDPNNSSDHVLLSNIYAVTGKWRDVAAVRRSMTDQRIKKEPGWSMIEVDKVMYNFVVGEGLNGVTEEAHEKLVEIMSSIRVEGGYIPEVGSVLHDIEDEEKENAVSMHSEKLAVAFGIARLCPGGLIRIIKNLRVCRDCHTVMNMIPKAYKRDIVLKDQKFRITSTCSKMDLVLAWITGISYFVYRNDLAHGVTEVIDLLNDKFTSLFHILKLSNKMPNLMFRYV